MAWKRLMPQMPASSARLTAAEGSSSMRRLASVTIVTRGRDGGR
jgi:hypothetical protein